MRNTTTTQPETIQRLSLEHPAVPQLTAYTCSRFATANRSHYSHQQSFSLNTSRQEHRQSCAVWQLRRSTTRSEYGSRSTKYDITPVTLDHSVRIDYTKYRLPSERPTKPTTLLNATAVQQLLFGSRSVSNTRSQCANRLYQTDNSPERSRSVSSSSKFSTTPYIGKSPYYSQWYTSYSEFSVFTKLRGKAVGKILSKKFSKAII